jgi:hypothetical protein
VREHLRRVEELLPHAREGHRAQAEAAEAATDELDEGIFREKAETSLARSLGGAIRKGRLRKLSQRYAMIRKGHRSGREAVIGVERRGPSVVTYSDHSGWGSGFQKGIDLLPDWACVHRTQTRLLKNSISDLTDIQPQAPRVLFEQLAFVLNRQDRGGLGEHDSPHAGA